MLSKSLSSSAAGSELDVVQSLVISAPSFASAAWWWQFAAMYAASGVPSSAGDCRGRSSSSSGIMQIVTSAVNVVLRWPDDGDLWLEVREAAVSGDARLPVDSGEAILTSLKSYRNRRLRSVQRGISSATRTCCSMCWIARSLLRASLGEGQSSNALQCAGA